jgi:hypothetical protein
MLDSDETLPGALASLDGPLEVGYHDERTQWGFYTPSEKADILQHAFLVQEIVWGPACWRLLNYLAFARSRDAIVSASHLRIVLRLLSILLPCGNCRFHMDKYLTLTPEPVDSYAEWVVCFHNDVSLRCGYRAMSVDEVAVETQERLNDERGALGCNDLWRLLLTLTCVSLPAHLCKLEQLIVHIAALLPWQAASYSLIEMTSSFYASKGELYLAIFHTRNKWAEQVGESQWDLLDIVTHTDPLDDWHVELAMIVELDLDKVRQRTERRMHALEGATQRANERIELSDRNHGFESR